MTDYDEATARYTALLAELETANARAADSPDDAELAAAAQSVYDQAQAAYADVLAGYGGDEAADQPLVAAVSDESDEVDELAIDEGADGESVETNTGEVHVETVVGRQPVASEYDLGDFGAPADTAAPAFGEEAPQGVFVLTRKPVATRFVPSDTPIEELSPISRNILPQRAKGKKSELSRERNIAGDLPTWSPLPPGEVAAVKRTGTKST